MSTLPFDELLSAGPSFADVQSGSSTVEEGKPEGDRVLSPFEDLMVGEVASPPQPDSTQLDTTKVHPVPKVFEELRSVKHRPQVRAFMNVLENGRWALGLAAQGMNVGADVLRAFTQGEAESNPEQFHQRLLRGRTIFDQMNVHAAITALESSSGLGEEDPVIRAKMIQDLKQKYDFLNDSTDLMLKPKLREKLAELEYGVQTGPQYLSIAEMIFGNTRPALESLPYLQSVPGIIVPPGLGDITFDLAKQLRKDPAEVTLGELSVHLLDTANRGWARAVAPIEAKLPAKSEAHLVKVPLMSKTMLVPGGLKKGFFSQDIPAFVGAAAMEGAEIYYDPLFIAAETGVAAKTANVALKGAVAYDEAVGKGTKKVLDKFAQAMAKKPTAYEPVAEAASKVAVATDVGAPEVFTWTPHIDSKAAPERGIRGAPPGGSISSSISSAATIGAEGGQTAAERAVNTIREATMDVDNRVGGVVDDMALTGTPEEMGKKLDDLSLPKGASPKLKQFNPSGPVIKMRGKTSESVKREMARPPFKTEPVQQAELFEPSLPARKPFVPGPPSKKFATEPSRQMNIFGPALPPEKPYVAHPPSATFATEPTQQLGMFGAGPTGVGGGFSLGEVSTGFKAGRDINLFERLLSPRYVLYDDPMDAVARGIYEKQRRSFFDSMIQANQYGEMFSGLNELLGKAGPKEQTQLSRRLIVALNASDLTAEKELAKLSGKEREVATQLRTVFKTWLDTKGVKRVPGQPLLESLGRQLWPEEEFLIVEKGGILQRGAFPPELTDVPVMDNIVMKHLYPGMIPADDIANAMRAVSHGIIRQDILKPAWKEMAEAAKNLPPRKRQFVELWIKDLQGVPSKWHEVFDEMTYASKAASQTPLYVSAVNEVSSAVLSGYYRGHLFGNLATFYANFFGQGMANQMATHGAFRTFEGLARHWQHAFDGVPKEVLTGSFEALFGKEVPKSTFGLKLRSQPGIKQFRNFWNEVVEKQLGMNGSEFTNRSWAMHVGLGEAIDKYNLAHGTKLTWQQVLRKEGVTDAVRNDMMFQAMMHSDQVNHVWGGAGSNPLLRRYLPHTGTALVGQFLNWFPKQSEFLFGPLIRRGDAGILTNYILYTGWLSSLAARAWGIDFRSSAYWGSIPSAQGIGAPFPAGPPVDGLWSLFSAIHEEVADDGDPNQAKRYWEEVGRHMEALTLPGVSAREKEEIFFRSLEDGGLYTPTHPFSYFFGVERPRELMGFTGPTAAEQQYPFGKAGGFDPNPENLERNMENILHSEFPARALGLPTESDRYRRRAETEIRRMNRVWQSLMSDIVNEMLIEVQNNRGVPMNVIMKSPRMQALTQAAESQGLPIKAMVKDRILDQALPRLLRVFNDSKKLTKQQTQPYLYDAFPDYFDNPTMVWDKVHPDSVPTQDPFEELMK